MSRHGGSRRSREDTEELEAATLMPYACLSSRSLGRRIEEAEDPVRTIFQRDRDRIIHCAAFRRLQGKTQVFLSDTGDHYRDRLTHTLEVAQIARTIAQALGANKDLCEALALAHDVGHAPFGHSGGDVLDQLMAEHGGFEHNRQSLRALDVLEVRYPDFDGLNLSYEVRESILKHKRPFEGPDYDDYHPDQGPLLEAQIVDAADGIAYNCHDVEDGLASGILDLEELESVPLWRETKAAVLARWPGLAGRVLRARVITRLIDYFVSDLLETSASNLATIDSVDDVRSNTKPLIEFSEDAKRADYALRAFLYERFYTHYKICRMRHRGAVILRGLFGAIRNTPGLMPKSFQTRAHRDGLERTIADYLSGMTDGFAQREYALLFQPGEGGVP